MIFVKPLQGLLPWFDLKVYLHRQIFMLKNSRKYKVYYYLGFDLKVDLHWRIFMLEN
jgi:hypothetical protein